MDSEIMEVKVEPDFLLESFDDEDDEENNEQIDNERDSVTSGKQRCIYCGKIYKKKYISMHLRTHSGRKPVINSYLLC